MRERGRIKRFFADKGYGFIRRQACGDVFFHVSAVETNNPDETIFEGAEMEFTVTQTDRGLRAVDVVPV